MSSEQKTLYFAKLEMASENTLVNRDLVGATKASVVYRYPEEMRVKIRKLRAKYRYCLNKDSLSVHQFHVVDQEAKAALETAVSEGDKALKALDERLYCRANFIPAVISPGADGGLSEKIVKASRAKIVSEALARAQPLVGKKMLKWHLRRFPSFMQRLARWNFLGDKDVASLLASIVEGASTGDAKPLVDMLWQEAIALDREGYYSDKLRPSVQEA